MLTVDIPGWRSLQLEVLLLDVNGTLTLDGELQAGVDAGLKALIQVGMLDVQLVSADTFGRLDNIAVLLGVHANRLGQASSRAVATAAPVESCRSPRGRSMSAVAQVCGASDPGQKRCPARVRKAGYAARASCGARTS